MHIFKYSGIKIILQWKKIITHYQIQLLLYYMMYIFPDDYIYLRDRERNGMREERERKR